MNSCYSNYRGNKIIEGDIMTTEQNNTKYVVLMFISIALLIFGSIMVDQKMIDILYFMVVMFYFGKYLLLVKNR